MSEVHPRLAALITHTATAVGDWGLPSDLLARARLRLRLMAVVFAVLSGIGVAVLWPLDVIATSNVPIHAAGVALSLGLYLATRWERVPDTQVLDLMLAIEVAYCAIASTAAARTVYLREGYVPEAIWPCIVIVAVPLLVPAPPWRVGIASAASALTVPLGLAAVAATTDLQPAPFKYVDITFNPGFAAVIAVFGSQAVYRLNLAVAEARQLGSYRLERRLGAGGMGEVWQASHRMLARPAAVKLIHPSLRGDGPGGTAVAQFEREAQVTATLQSPHTVVLYDFGLADDNTVFYVMELLRGIDLDAMVRQFGAVPAERAIHLLVQACASLQEAHDAGLVHRDIKPANLLACRYGGKVDFVKVLDFGLVTLRPGLEPTRASSHAVLGTPAFLPPEVATAPDRVDGRADLYALGCVAVWLVAGRLVFEADSPGDLVAAHVERPAPRLSALSELSVPAGLDDVVARCLSKDPDDRPATAADLAALLQAVPVDRPWTPDRAQRWWAIHAPE